MNLKKIIFLLSVAVLLIMHSVGFYGLTHGQMQYFRDLTCVNLLITFSLFIVGGFKFEKNYLLIALIIALLGFFIEVIGVKTKAIFGYYEYTETMGPRFLEVPLIIGVNWSILILACSSIVNKAYTNIFIKAFIGASLMLLFDIVLEPIAFKYNYWQWDAKIIPLQNYIAWWLVSFVLILGVLKFLKNPENKMAYWVYGVQMVFFCLLNLL
jgi:uncharacterized membrane protein